MGKRTKYAAGTFCWVELGAADAKAATQFYSSVLGWQIDTQPFESGEYHTCRVNGSAVAGVYEAAAEMSGWMTYVSVDDVDKSSTLAQELGATAMSDVIDVADLGRMAVLQDPQGGMFSVWQSQAMAGAELVNDPGALTLTQLNTQDPSRAQLFYEGLFGWNFREQAPAEYWGIYVGDALNAAMMQNSIPAPDHWLVYFTAPTTLEAAVELINSNDGSIVVPPTSIPGGGRFTVAQDPQGSFFALFEGRTDD